MSQKIPAHLVEAVEVNLTHSRKAILTITIEEEGLGPVDPATHRKPTGRELDLIGQRLAQRAHLFPPA